MKKPIPPGRISVLVANPNPISGDLYARALESEEEFEVVERVSEMERLGSSLEQHKPKALLLSIHFKALAAERFQVLANLLASHPDVACVLLLDSSEPEIVVDAFRARAKGVFVCSEGDLNLLRKCIRQVVAGQIWIEPVQMNNIISTVPSVHWKEAISKKPASCVLTPREEEVVQLLSEGLRNREIAARLNLSDNTIKNYIFRIFEKLGFSNRVEVVLYATNRPQEDKIPPQTAR
jgi:two-component system nitrate/nitrite response regulator NarL